jgi:leucyl aminopeptidase
MLPDFTLAPPTRRPRLPSERALGALDALIVLTAPGESALWQQLPEPQRWHSLLARERPLALGQRTMTLGNARQTLVVLGFAKHPASPFERLSFAGKLIRELAARRPARLGFLVSRALPDAPSWCEALLTAAWTESFALPAFRTRTTPRWRLKAIELFDAPALPLERVAASARAGNLARALTALPPNELDARAYRRLLVKLAARHALRLRWYSRRELQRLGAGAFLAVARGNSADDAGIAHLRWLGARAGEQRGARGSPDVALIGKGILFDTGGVNLKPHRHMLDMHTDMAGSAVALASLVALSELRAPLCADAWLAISENNISATAYRPQEVVRAVNGLTIQVVHSDAEGRMVLADTLALAARTHPRLTIDYATLTGTCVQALTERYSGVFTNRPELIAALTAAGNASGERVWSFPLDEDFDSDLDSSVADILQCTSDGKGDHILAARFLKRFIGDEHAWVHVDLSSAVRRGGLAHVGTEITGFGVRFTLELLLSQRLQEQIKPVPRARARAVRPRSAVND